MISITSLHKIYLTIVAIDLKLPLHNVTENKFQMPCLGTFLVGHSFLVGESKEEPTATSEFTSGVQHGIHTYLGTYERCKSVNDIC